VTNGPLIDKNVGSDEPGNMALSQRPHEPEGADGGPGAHLVTASSTRTPAAVVLILHGGRAVGRQPVPRWSSAAARMRPFGSAIRRMGPDLAVAFLRYRHRGWNGADGDPVVDVAFALDELRGRYDAPVVLVGHSMGGRAALRSAARPEVRGVVALAPWLPEREPVEPVADRDLVIMHGARDRTTSSRSSAAFAHDAQRLARSVLYVEITGGDHAMLRRAGTWHRLTADFVDAMAHGRDPRTVLSLDPDSTCEPWARI
jgi:pimeloyl-ACP methyl ester carboxylesterase